MKYHKWKDFDFSKTDLTDYQKFNLQDMLEKNNPIVDVLLNICIDLNKRLDGTVVYLVDQYPAEASSITQNVKKIKIVLDKIEGKE